MSSQDSTTPMAAVQDAAPVRRRFRRPAPPPVDATVLSSFKQDETSEEDQKKERLSQRMIRWFKGAVAAGYGLSLLFHGVLLLGMSLIVFHEILQQESITTVITEGEEIETMEDIMDVRIDMPAGEMAAVSPMDASSTMETVDQAPTSVVSGVEDSLDSLFDKEGAGGAGGGGFLAPKGAKVFTKGSFSVWTEPNDPRPGEDYVIVVVVRLPDRIKRYQATDLKGMVIGTDGYRQAIPGAEYTRGRVYLPMKDHTAQLLVPVPGAASRVRDKINIESRTLNEEQTLEIEF